MNANVSGNPATASKSSGATSATKDDGNGARKTKPAATAGRRAVGGAATTKPTAAEEQQQQEQARAHLKMSRGRNAAGASNSTSTRDSAALSSAFATADLGLALSQPFDLSGGVGGAARDAHGAATEEVDDEGATRAMQSDIRVANVGPASEFYLIAPPQPHAADYHSSQFVGVREDANESAYGAPSGWSAAAEDDMRAPGGRQLYRR